MPVVRVILREGQEKRYHEANASIHTPDRTLRIMDTVGQPLDSFSYPKM